MVVVCDRNGQACRYVVCAGRWWGRQANEKNGARNAKMVEVCRGNGGGGVRVPGVCGGEIKMVAGETVGGNGGVVCGEQSHHHLPKMVVELQAGITMKMCAGEKSGGRW